MKETDMSTTRKANALAFFSVIILKLFGCLRMSKKMMMNLKKMGPVVQSIVSLTRSLRDQLVKCFTTS